MAQAFFVFQTAFSLWMLVDAINRGCSSYWYLVVLVPFGEWVYFFMVKIHDPEFDGIRRFFRGFTTRKPNIDQLRYRVSQSPSFQNKLTFGQALYDQGVHGDAAQQFEEALKISGDSDDARYGLALSKIALGEQSAAIQHLRALIAHTPAFEDYSPWLDLAQALAKNGQVDEALETLQQLVKLNCRLCHRVAYAQYLIHGGKPKEAKEQLMQGLADYSHGPKYVKRYNKSWARKAEKMLKKLATVS